MLINERHWVGSSPVKLAAPVEPFVGTRHIRHSEELRHQTANHQEHDYHKGNSGWHHHAWLWPQG